MAECRLCAIENCGKAAYVRGWCTTHYQRWLKTGDPLLGGWQKKIVCDADGCSGKVFARGLCSKHYKNADFRPICSIDGCGKKFYGRGMCLMHYKRLCRHGSVDIKLRPTNGECAEWIAKHVHYAGDECLIWLFWRDKHGYGRSREMCIAAHGEPPTHEHEAAHSCGKGHEGCVNPRHLYWATHAENQAEMAKHGTSHRGKKKWNVKLTEDDVRRIRILDGRISQRRLAEMYGVVHQTISDIQVRKSWYWLDN